MNGEMRWESAVPFCRPDETADPLSRDMRTDIPRLAWNRLPAQVGKVSRLHNVDFDALPAWWEDDVVPILP